MHKGHKGQKTDFSEMSASFKIAGGVAQNDDLKAQSPFLRLGGAAGESERERQNFPEHQ